MMFTSYSAFVSETCCLQPFRIHKRKEHIITTFKSVGWLLYIHSSLSCSSKMWTHWCWYFSYTHVVHSVESPSPTPGLLHSASCCSLHDFSLHAAWKVLLVSGPPHPAAVLELYFEVMEFGLLRLNSTCTASQLSLLLLLVFHFCKQVAE